MTPCDGNLKKPERLTKRTSFELETQKFKSKPFGTVRIKVETNEGRRHLKLTNFALVHGFLTNIVSMQLITKLGFHWRSRAPINLECEDVCLAY